MQTRLALVCMALGGLAWLASCGKPQTPAPKVEPPPAGAPTVDAEMERLAGDVYVYAYPPVLTDVARAVDTASVPIDTFRHDGTFPNASSTDVANPNADFLYSQAWLDRSDGPVILTTPDTRSCYHMIAMLAPWTSVVASLGTRTTAAELARARGESAPRSQPNLRDAAALVLVELGESIACAYSTASLDTIAQVDVPERVWRDNRVTPNAPTDAPDLKSAPPRGQVTAISHCGDTYWIKTADGRVNKISEFDLRFRTNSSNVGPRPGKPVIVDRDAQGSPAVIVFAAPSEISSFINEACPMRGDEAPF